MEGARPGGLAKRSMAKGLAFEHIRAKVSCRLLLEEGEGGRGEQWRVGDVVVR
jgi:hypothetical protein